MHNVNNLHEGILFIRLIVFVLILNSYAHKQFIMVQCSEEV